MKTLREENLENMLVGCTVLGTGGGGDLGEGLERIKKDLKNGKRFRMVSLDEIPDNALVASPYHCGSLTSSFKEGKVQEDLLSFQALQEYLGEVFFAAVATELGGGNTATALSVAAYVDIPVVDGDVAGRSVPDLQHSTFFINDVPIAPMTVASRSGDVIIVKEVSDDFQAEKIARAVAVASGGMIGVTDHPTRGRVLKTSVIAGSLSYAEKIGEVLKKKADYAEVAKAGNGYVLFKGRVTNARWKDDGGFTVGEVQIDGTEEFSKSSYRVWYKNEHIMAWKDGRVDVTAPDLISILSQEDSMPITNPHCKKGDRVVVIGYPAPELWRTKKGIEVLGPKSFGFDSTYVPIEETRT